MAQYKVFVTDKSFPSYDNLIARLERQGVDVVFAGGQEEDVFIREGADADVIINSFAQVTAGFIGSLSRCRLILRTGIGVNTIDVEAATGRGIPVSYVPDYCREEVADHTAALILAAARKVAYWDREMRKGVWDSVAAGYVPRLSGKILGLCGFGSIARLVARRMQGFGMEILAYDPYLNGDVFDAMGARRAGTLDEIFAQADILSLNLPLTEETRYLINRESIARMKKEVCIVNTARGPLINEADLFEALKSGRIYAAGLDVFEEEPLAPDSPLRGLDNVVLTPHAAYYSVQSLPNLQEKSIQEVERVLRGEPPVNWYNQKEMNAEAIGGI